MVAHEALRAALGGVRIVHQISGRVRFKLVGEVARPQVRMPPLQDLDAVIDRIPGVRSVRANALARTCVVEYDPDVIPDDAWQDFLAGTRSAAAAILERTLAAAHREIADAKP